MAGDPASAPHDAAAPPAADGLHEAPLADAPHDLRPVQLVELGILREFARRCDEASLRWMVIGGTLLGAARHRGFIPWDDDVDVGMPREDYERFDALCRSDPAPGYEWQAYTTDPAYPYVYGKLLRTDTHGVEWAVGHLPIRHAVGIDVFPLDGAPGSPLARRIHGLAFKVGATAIGARIRRTGIRRRLGSYAFRLVPRSLAIRLIERLARRFPFAASPFAVNGGGAWGYRRECQPRERFVPTATLEFEGMPVPAPGRWHEYLGHVYGDYMELPPPERRRTRHTFAVLSLEHGAPEPLAAEHPAAGARRVASVAVRARRAALASVGTAVVRAGFAIGRLRPLQARVVLGIGEGGRLDGNLACICRELARREPPIPVRVVRYRAGAGLRGRLESAWQAFRAGYHLATARLFVVDDWFFPMYAITPRRGTVRAQVWHAAGAFKKFGYSVLDRSFGASDEMARRVPIHSNYDVCLVSSEAAVPHYMEAFRLPRGRFTAAIGIPRSDLFFDDAGRTRAIEAVRGRYVLPAGRRVLLYAPTFRGDTVRAARYDDDLDLAVLRARLGDAWVVLMRLHPFVRRHVKLGPEAAGFAIDASDWPDINELMLVSDLLVTDYSSAIFEFALLGRPMAFLARDHEAYARERGLYFDYRTGVPGPVFESTRALADWIAAGDFPLDRVRAFAREWFEVADGHASERFVDRVVVPALRGEPPTLPDARSG